MGESVIDLKRVVGGNHAEYFTPNCARVRVIGHRDAIELRSDGRRHLVFDPAFGSPAQDWFDSDHWLRQGRARAAGGGRGSSWFVDQGDVTWVLRHYKRGGRAATLSDDRYIFTGVERSRAFREWRLLHQLKRMELPGPRPVAARIERHGFTYTAHLITVAIPASRTLGHLLAADDLDADLMHAVGRCIRGFHDKGVWHADLNAHNILIDDQQRVFLIDFDRGRFRSGKRWQPSNLARLERSLNKLARKAGLQGIDSGMWKSLQTGYRDFP